MSKEMDLLRRLASGDNRGDFFISNELLKEIEAIIAQPEQEQEVLKKDWVNFGHTAGRKEGYKRGYAIAREDFKQKVINAFGVDDE